jgi:hypothetical protein
LHGYLDLITVGAIFVAPETLRVRNAAASSVPARVFAGAILVSALLTDYGPSDGYELGGIKALPVSSHLALDAVGGTVVMTLPWITGSWRKGWNYWAPQAMLGVTELFFAATTKTK